MNHFITIVVRALMAKYNLESPSKIWYATTDYTQLYLVELSLFLESVDP